MTEKERHAKQREWRLGLDIGDAVEIGHRAISYQSKISWGWDGFKVVKYLLFERDGVVHDEVTVQRRGIDLMFSITTGQHLGPSTPCSADIAWYIRKPERETVSQ